MTRTADVPARETVSRILREMTRLGLKLWPETLRCGATRLYKRIYGSLVQCLKSKELQGRRIALDTATTLCAEHTAARYQEHDPTDLCRVVSATRAHVSFTPRAPALRCADVRGFGTVPAHLPRALP